MLESKVLTVTAPPQASGPIIDVRPATVADRAVVVKVLQRASNRPVGYCDSAVMLNAKLRPGVNLLHVIAMTRALGEQLSPKEQQPEIYRWTDGTASTVTCEFARGKLVKWELFRPHEAGETAGS